jgi:flagellar basal body P-ring formation protein FlgA
LGIPAGTVITAGMIHVRQPTDGDRRQLQPAQSTADVVGRISRRWLPANQAISRPDLRSVPILKAGTFIDITFDALGVRLSTQGLALEAGGLGDTVRVRNVRSGIVIAGRVISAVQIAVDTP